MVSFTFLFVSQSILVGVLHDLSKAIAIEGHLFMRREL